MGPKEFTIDKVSWHTKIKDNPESPENIRERFKVIVAFLQRNGLTVRELLQPNEEPKDDFAIRTSDLTEEGLEVMKKGYDKWLKKIVNKRKDLGDVRILDQALTELRMSD
jgi:hypothetical protein